MELTVLDNPHYKPPTYEGLANKITHIRPSKDKPDVTLFLFDGVQSSIRTPNPEKFNLQNNAPGRAYIAVNMASTLSQIRRAPQAFRILPKS